MEKILPTNDLLFKKALTTPSKENILKGFVQDMTGEEFETVQAVNPYHIDSYKESMEDERNLGNTEVDVLAETKEGNYITIKMQVASHEYFLERSLYYTCQAYIKSYADDKKLLIEDNLYSSLRSVYGIFVMNFDPFNPDHSCLNSFKLINEDYDYPIEEIEFMNSMELIYFSLTNKNSSEANNSSYWQDYFKGQEISNQAPDYIKEAKEIVAYHNLNDTEREIMDTISKRETIRKAELSTQRRLGIKEGREEGREEGLQEKEIEIIRRAHEMDLSIKMIADLAGVSEDYVKEVLER